MGRLEGGNTQCYSGAGALWEDESMAGHTLNLRLAECIFTLDRVTMPPVISLPLTVLLLLLICSLPPTCTHSIYLFHIPSLCSLSSCGFPSHFFFFSSLNQIGFEFSTSLLNKLLPCSFFPHLLSEFHLSFFLSSFPPLPLIHCWLLPP